MKIDTNTFHVKHPDGPVDVLVIGAGHAGCEAALAAARRGARVRLITQNLDTIAKMSCNPAIGGVGKGHMVREIDAMGGAMGFVADASALQYRLLNRGKGPAVQATRAQCDRRLYHIRMRQVLADSPRPLIWPPAGEDGFHPPKQTAIPRPVPGDRCPRWLFPSPP